MSSNLIAPLGLPPYYVKPTFLEEARSKIAHAFTYLMKQEWLFLTAITNVFFRTMSLVLPSSVVYKCEAVWGHLQGIYLRWKAAWKESQMLKEIEALRAGNHKISSYCKNLLAQFDQVVSMNRHITYERDRALAEVDRLTQERRDILLSQVPVQMELTVSKRENQQLKDEKSALITKNQQMEQERDAAIKEKNVINDSLLDALQELATAQIRLKQEAAYEELNRHFEDFRNQYATSPLSQQTVNGAAQKALKELVPAYIKHRKEANQRLQETINLLDLNSPMNQSLKTALEEILRAPDEKILRERLNKMLDELDLNSLRNEPLKAIVEGIFRLSNEEMLHLEDLVKLLHLLEWFRQKLSSYVNVPNLERSDDPRLQ